MAHKVVITGMGIVSAIGHTLVEFTDALRSGRSGIGVRGEAGPTGPVLMAEVRDFSLRDALDATLPDEAAALRAKTFSTLRRSPWATQAAAVAAGQAWCQAGLMSAAIPAEAIGLVAAGHNLGQNHQHAAALKHAVSPAHVNPSYALHFMDSDVLGCISEALGIRGEGCTAGGASASGNVGLIQGFRLVRFGLADCCLVVGVPADLSPVELQGFMNLGAMRSGPVPEAGPATACRPFDMGRDGFIPGQAAACLVLESEASALGRGAAILAELAGAAIALDANRLSNPSAAGESRSMAKALADAGLEPGEIDYLNSHGTASPLGDETELQAIGETFQVHLDRLWINATKALTGHCLWSAGLVEAVATVQQLRHSFVHSNPNLAEPMAAGFRFAGRRAEAAELRAALSNSFGFGGINSSIVIRRTA
ncbi:beta-ketoacyl synthase N-terminal-like domain-containing protein [Methylomagnum sp.]